MAAFADFHQTGRIIQFRGKMKRERIVEFVGGNDEEIAYLRLLLRKAASQLTDRWRLRREEDSHVDLVIIHDISDASEPASSNAAPRRVRLIDSVFGAAGMETAAWPPTTEQLVRTLNSTAVVSNTPAAAVSAPVIQQNIYDDLFEDAPSDRWRTGVEIDPNAPLLDQHVDWVPPPRQHESLLTLQAEELFRREPHPDHKESLAAIRLTDNVDIEATDAKTIRGGSRKDLRDANGVLAGTLHTLTFEESKQRHPFATYLTGRLLPGPARIEVCHIMLTLDPRNRQYYARSTLAMLEECCTQSLRRGDWQSLAASEFAAIKEQIAPRPYAELLWLCTYIDERPSAEASIDPDTRYRLIQSIDLTRDYPGAARVAHELQQRCTITVAAAAAGVPLAVAQRVAHAFDTMGFLIPD
jgi:hypothetical protein